MGRGNEATKGGAETSARLVRSLREQAKSRRWISRSGTRGKYLLSSRALPGELRLPLALLGKQDGGWWRFQAQNHVHAGRFDPASNRVPRTREWRQLHATRISPIRE